MKFLDKNKFKNLIVRKIKKKDIEDKYYEWFNDSNINKFTSHKNYHYTKDMALEYFNTLKNNKKIIHFVLEDIIIGKIVASFSLQSIDSKFYSAELARTIGNAKYLNIGLGTSMTKFLINYAFNKTSIEFIWVGNNYKNISAIISNKKNGFIEMNKSQINKYIKKIDNNSIYMFIKKNEK